VLPRVTTSIPIPTTFTLIYLLDNIGILLINLQNKVFFSRKIMLFFGEPLIQNFGDFLLISYGVFCLVTSNLYIVLKTGSVYKGH